MTKKQEDKENAIKHLQAMLKSGDTVYTVLRHVSSSGMSRRIDLYKIVDGKGGYPSHLQYLSGYAAQAMGRTLDRKGGIRISGCGMDMGFAIVDDLRGVLFGYTRTQTGIKYNGSLRQEWI